jgi:hypothetical protein
MVGNTVGVIVVSNEVGEFVGNDVGIVEQFVVEQGQNLCTGKIEIPQEVLETVELIAYSHIVNGIIPSGPNMTNVTASGSYVGK